MGVYDSVMGSMTGSPKVAGINTTLPGNINVQEINGLNTNLEVYKKAAKLPNTTTKTKIKSLAAKVGAINAENFKLSLLAKSQLQLVRGVNRNVAIKAQYQTGMMAASTQYQNTIEQYGIKNAEFALNSETVEASYKGYLEVMADSVAQTATSLTSDW